MNAIHVREPETAGLPPMAAPGRQKPPREEVPYVKPIIAIVGRRARRRGIGLHPA